jgi:hypothetical protein
VLVSEQTLPPVLALRSDRAGGLAVVFCDTHLLQGRLVPQMDDLAVQPE